MSRIQAGQVHLWWFDTDNQPVRISADEAQRATRFRSETDRVRFMASRSMLRSTLAWYTGETPDTVCFEYGPNGKPHLAIGRLQFNVSHSGDQGLIGVTLGSRIGVDIEHVQR